jgi:hypothetical protein
MGVLLWSALLILYKRVFTDVNDMILSTNMQKCVKKRMTAQNVLYGFYSGQDLVLDKAMSYSIFSSDHNRYPVSQFGQIHLWPKISK